MTSTTQTVCPAGTWTEVITNNGVVRMQPSPQQAYGIWVDTDPPADDVVSGITPNQPGFYFELDGLGEGVSVYVRPNGGADLLMTTIAT